jgi:N-hydroxyarylamine O-acetyltransferase
MALLVTLRDGAVLADVGFGADGPLEPVLLESGVEARAGIGAHRVRREDDVWVLEGRLAAGEWQDLYSFTLERQYPVDYEMANHFTSTWPESPFVKNLTAQRSRPERRLVLRNRELLTVDVRGAHTEAIRDPEHLLAVLDEHFGLRFPPGTRFTRPEF